MLRRRLLVLPALPLLPMLPLSARADASHPQLASYYARHALLRTGA